MISAMASPAKKRAADRKKKSEKAVRPTFSTDSLKRKSKKKVCIYLSAELEPVPSHEFSF